MKNLLAYAQLVRLPNTFTAWADILLGALATGFLSERFRWLMLWFASFMPDGYVPTRDGHLASVGSELRQWFILACLLLASTLLYWSGMVWNDYFDLDQDRKERPGRPIASGRISLRAALVFALGLMAAGVFFAGLADLLSNEGRWRSLPIALAIVGCIYLYDGLLKATIAGPVFMGLCRFFNIVLGLTVVNAMPPFWGWLLALVIGTYIAGVTWFARTEARESSKRMLISAAAVMLASFLLALAIPALALESAKEIHPSVLFPYLIALFGSYLGLAVWRAIQRPDPVRVQAAIMRAILGLILLDAILASAFVGTAGLLLAVLLLPGMILGRWLYST
jgi:4-hydroxybenzoate polyprenyltransferase